MIRSIRRARFLRAPMARRSCVMVATLSVAAAFATGPIGPATPARAQVPTTTPTIDDPTLHAAFDEGERRVSWSEGRTDEELRAGIAFLETVIAGAPRIAEAQALLAQAHSALYAEADRTPARRLRAERAAETALRLAPERAASHLAQGLVFLRVMDDPARASVEIGLAREIDPDDPEILFWVGRLRAREGRHEDARRVLGKAHELAPRQPVVLDALAEVAFARGELERATVHAERALALDATDRRRLRLAGLRLASGGDVADLRPSLDTVTGHDLEVAHLLRRAGALDAALARLDRVEVEATARPGAAAALGVDRALTLHLRGDRERARNAARDVLDALREGAVTLRDPLLLATALALDGDAAASAGFLRQLLDDLDPGHDVHAAADLLERAAFVHVLREDPDAAVHLLRRRLVLDRRLTPALLRRDPRWGTLRGREDFEALLDRADAWAPVDD